MGQVTCLTTPRSAPASGVRGSELALVAGEKANNYSAITVAGCWSTVLHSNTMTCRDQGKFVDCAQLKRC